jgi:murein DD-endopeptidase MepM/ murein hydrolase activator NlpD
LQIGQYLKIPPLPGILYTVKNTGETIEMVAAKYEVSVEKLTEVNNLAVAASLDAGDSIFVPDGKLDWVSLQEINGDLFAWPLKKVRLTSYYSWRRSPFTGARTFHNGLDLGAPSGTPVYPGLDGWVTATAYNNTFGNYIILRHHSGYSTLYGHLSTVLVSEGEYVRSNTVIGRVGSTGLSTGPHLHFTVFKNGRSVNPLYLLP